MAEFLDRIPVVSQVKHITHKALGDIEGAEQNATNYIYSNPGVSHVVAAVTKVTGNNEAAEKCLEGGNKALNAIPVVGQIKALTHLATGNLEKADEALTASNQVLGSILDATPIIGHVKGAFHLATGDEERAKQSIEEANRTSLVVVAGSAGLVTAGPAGAIGAGIAAGVTVDAVNASGDEEDKKPAPLQVLENPKDINAWCDAGISMAADALAGFGGGQLVKNVATLSRKVTNTAVKVKKQGKLLSRSTFAESESTGLQSDLLHKAFKDISTEADKIASHLPHQPADGLALDGVPTNFSHDSNALRPHDKRDYQ